MWDVIASILAWVLFAVSILAILRMFFDRLLMVMLYGRSRYQSCRAVTSMLGLKSQRILTQRILKWLLFLIGALALAEHLQRSQQPWRNLGQLWLPMIALMVGCVQFFGQMRPGVILVLGASEPQSMRLHEKLSNALFPHRVVSLLESPRTIESVSVRTPGDCFRVTLGDWRDTVWRFARSVLLVVVDLRTITPPVEEELAFIVREDLQFKTILLKPTADRLHIPQLHDCSIVDTEEACLEQVRQTFESYKSLPSERH